MSVIINVNSEYLDPYKVIEDFFSAAPIKYYRKYIFSILKAAYSDGNWKKSDPDRIRQFQNQIERLIQASHLFAGNGMGRIALKRNAVLSRFALAEEIRFSSIFRLHLDKLIWESFPRHLSKKEFVNPYQVSDKIFKYNSPEEWIMIIRTVISYAKLPNGSESDLEFDFLKLNRYLQKLIESSYLINIRCNGSNPAIQQNLDERKNQKDKKIPRETEEYEEWTSEIH